MEYIGLAIFATVVLTILVYPTKPKQKPKPEVEFAVFEDWVPLTSSHDKVYTSLRVSDR